MYYYNQNAQVSLTPLKYNYIVKIRDDFNPQSVIQQLQNLPGLIISESYGRIEIINYQGNLNNVKNMNGIESAIPVYVTPQGRKMMPVNYILLKIKPGVNQQLARAAIQAQPLVQKRAIEPYEYYAINNGANPYTIANTLYETGLMDFCQPDFLAKDIELLDGLPNDKYFNKQFALHNTGQEINWQQIGVPDADIDAPEAWNLTKGSPDVYISVIDDGIFNIAGEMSLANMVIVDGCNKGYFIDSAFVVCKNLTNFYPLATLHNNPLSKLRPERHGTACAGIIAAKHNGNRTAGIAPQCKIMPIRCIIGVILGPYLCDLNVPFPTNESFADAIYTAVNNNATVLSLSWGGAFWDDAIASSLLHAVNSGRNGKGTFVSIAAGNTRNPELPLGDVVFPANYTLPGAMCVGGSDKTDHISDFSPINNLIEVTAPTAKELYVNREVWTLDIEQTSYSLPSQWHITGYNPDTPLPENVDDRDVTGCFGGTSAAAPVVAGVAGLILSVNPELTAAQVEEIIKQTADKVGGYNYNWNPNKPGHSKELGYGRVNAYKAVLRALTMTGQLPATDITITENQTIEYPVVANANIIVKANSSLTVKSAISFVSGKKIIVEQGAKLIMNGGCLKGNNCTWQGIELWGNKSQQQLDTIQGTVELKNGATIEDAVVAIQTYKPGSRSYSGGIVFAEDAIFRNNQTDVLFEQYANIDAGREYANLSYFKSCVFETTDDCLFETVRGHARLMAVNGIKFYGCNFDDRRTRIDVLRNGAKGIDAAFSGFMVDNHPLTNQPCEFNNLLYGVYASGLSNPARFSVSVRQAAFASWRGVYLRDITAAIAELNLFSVPVYNVRADATDYRYGLYLDACNTYTVQENQFTSDAHQLSPLVGSSFGLVVNSSGAFANQLYKNTFVGFGVASEAIGINNGLDNGLQFKCNDYTNGQYDIYVYGSTSTVAASQGSLTDPANNLFSNGGPILVSDLENDGNFITYYHADPLTNSRVKPLIYTTNKVTLVNTLLPNNSNSCPSQITGISYSFGQIKTEQQQVNAIKSFLEGKVDKGNTFDLEMDIVMANESTAYPAYINLMQTAPYVSENVLEELGGQEYAFANTMIRDVMIANPHAAKSEKIMEKLGERVNSLPEYMLNQIRHGENIISQFENYKAELLNKKITLNKMVTQYQKSLINKDSTDNSNEILNVYSQLDDPMFKITWAKILIGEGNFETALDILSDAFNLADEKDKPYFQAIQEFYINYTQWLTEGQSIDSLGNDAILWLKNIPADHPAYPMAITLLSINDPIVYQESLLLPEPGQLKSAKTTDYLENKQFEFLAYPNPANQQVTIMYDFNSYTDLSFQVSDITGRVVFREKLQSNCSAFLLDVSLFQNGLYYCSIITGRSTLETIPLNIIR